MKTKNIFFYFLFFLIGNLFIAYLAIIYIPYRGGFPYKDILKNFHLPNFITNFAGFDGLHYILIAKDNYAQYEQAFFPLYPVIIKFINIFFNNFFWSGIFISNFFFLLSLMIINQYLKLAGWKEKKIILFFLFFLFFPTSFFFSSLYTESLFLFLFISSLYFLKKEEYSKASLFAFFSALTKIVGIFLIVPFSVKIIALLINNRNKVKKVFNFKTTVLFFSPILGFSAYAFYLWKKYRDPLLFFHVQPIFGANRSTKLIFLPQVYFRYLKIFLTANHNFQFFVAMFEVIIFTMVFFTLAIYFLKKFSFENTSRCLEKSAELGMLLFSIVNIFLPTLTGTFSSIPRYSLLSLSFFVILVQIKNNYLRNSILFLFLIFHILIEGFFIQGYFVS